MFRRLVLSTLTATLLGAVPVAGVQAQQRGIVIREAPPPPREEARPSPRRGQEWAPGYWAWREGRHQWVPGHWLRERRGQYWVPDTWEHHDGQWMLRHGHWARGNRDRDRGGVLEANPDRDTSQTAQ